MKTKELKALRIKHDCTQDNCAKLLGISRNTYNKKENGKKSFMFDEVMELLKSWDELEKVNDLID